MLLTTIRDLLSNDERWVVPEVKAVCQLAWAIILRARSHILPDGTKNFLRKQYDYHVF